MTNLARNKKYQVLEINLWSLDVGNNSSERAILVSGCTVDDVAEVLAAKIDDYDSCRNFFSRLMALNSLPDSFLTKEMIFAAAAEAHDGPPPSIDPEITTTHI